MIAVALMALASLLGGDPRSEVLLRQDCRSTIARREITLFANGTLRLRVGLEREGRLSLAEVGPEEVEGYRRRIAAFDLSRLESPALPIAGEWVERCELEVTDAAGVRHGFRFGRLDTLSLSLSGLAALATELAARVEQSGDSGRFPPDFQPRVGQCLERADGALFRVRRFTSDRQAVELVGLAQPLTIYVPRDSVRREFAAERPCPP